MTERKLTYAEELIRRVNEEVENDITLNPYGLRAGGVACLESGGVFKIVKFSKEQKKVIATVMQIYSQHGTPYNGSRPIKMDIGKLKPLAHLLPVIANKIETNIKFLGAIKQLIADSWKPDQTS